MTGQALLLRFSWSAVNVMQGSWSSGLSCVWQKQFMSLTDWHAQLKDNNWRTAKAFHVKFAPVNCILFIIMFRLSLQSQHVLLVKVKSSEIMREIIFVKFWKVNSCIKQQTVNNQNYNLLVNKAFVAQTQPNMDANRALQCQRAVRLSPWPPL